MSDQLPTEIEGFRECCKKAGSTGWIMEGQPKENFSEDKKG
jgi:hypothetical protein